MASVYLGRYELPDKGVQNLRRLDWDAIAEELVDERETWFSPELQENGNPEEREVYLPIQDASTGEVRRQYIGKIDMQDGLFNELRYPEHFHR